MEKSELNRSLASIQEILQVLQKGKKYTEIAVSNL